LNVQIRVNLMEIRRTYPVMKIQLKLYTLDVQIVRTCWEIWFCWK